MRNSILFLLAVSAFVVGASDYSGLWKAAWANSLGRSGVVECALSQSGKTVVGTVVDESGSMPFRGTDEGDSLVFHIVSKKGSVIDGSALPKGADSVTFHYSYRIDFGDSIANGKWDSVRTVVGGGTAKRPASQRLLTVNVVYTGTRVIGDDHPISVFLMGEPTDMAHPKQPRMTLPLFSSSGKVVFPMTDSGMYYVTACADMPADFNPRFLATDMKYPCAAWKNAGGVDSIKSDSSRSIEFEFGDANFMEFPAAYPGGLLEFLGCSKEKFEFDAYYGNHAIAADTIGSLYLLGRNSAIHRYSRSYQALGVLTDGKGDTIRASDLQAMPNGDLYALLRAGAGKVLRRRAGQNPSIDTIDLGGTGSHSRIAVGPQGVMASWNESAQRLERFDSTGKLLASRDSSLVRADRGVSRDFVKLASILFDRKGRLLVGIDSWGEDSGYDAIVTYDTLLHPVGTLWESYQFDSPLGMALGDQGDLYVVSHWRDNVAVFDAAGKLTSATWFEEPGKDGGRMKEPTDVAWGGDAIYVADAGNQRVCSFRRKQNLSTVAARAGGVPRDSRVVVAQVRSGRLDAVVSLAHPAQVSLVLRDTKGRLERAIALGALKPGSSRVRMPVHGIADGFHLAQVRIE